MLSRLLESNPSISSGTSWFPNTLGQPGIAVSKSENKLHQIAILSLYQVCPGKPDTMTKVFVVILLVLYNFSLVLKRDQCLLISAF